MYTVLASQVFISADAEIFIESIRQHVNDNFTPATIPTVNRLLDHWLITGGLFTEKQFTCLIAIIDKVRIVEYGIDFRIMVPIQWSNNPSFETGYVLDGDHRTQPILSYPLECPKPPSGLVLPVMHVKVSPQPPSF